MFKNNFAVLLVDAALMKISFWLNMQDPIIIMLLFSVPMALWSGICIFRLLKKAGYSYAGSFMGLVLFAGFVPLWGGTFCLYTDCVSLSFGIWAYYMTDRASEASFKWVYYLLAGFLWGFGYAIKPTVCISLVAVSIVVFLTAHWKEWLKTLPIILIGFFVFQFGLELLWNQTPAATYAEEYMAPPQYWFALGLCGDGGVYENAEFSVECLETPGIEAKKEIIQQHISENIQELWNFEHILSKARRNFASGHMGLPTFYGYNENVMYEFFNDYGQYGGYAIMYSSGYLYAILLFGILGSILHLKDNIQEATVPRLAVVGRLTLYGLVLFLMLFEANNRQLYNHMPWYALVGAIGCERVCGSLYDKVDKLLTEKRNK